MLADAFEDTGWTEGSHQLAGKQGSQQAIASRLYCHEPKLLEYRFAQTHGTFNVAVAQDMLSPTSEDVLEFSLTADGRQVVTKTIAFKQTQKLSTSLEGIAVIKVGVKINGSCHGDGAIALLTRVWVEG